MSISPQSLARTRDKRSLKTPARFEDFSDMPPEVTYRSVGDAVKIVDNVPTSSMKASPAPKVAANGSKSKGSSYCEKPSAGSKPTPPPQPTSTTSSATPLTNSTTATTHTTGSTTSTTTTAQPSTPTTTAPTSSATTASTQAKSGIAASNSKATTATTTSSSKGSTNTTTGQTKSSANTSNAVKGTTTSTTTQAPTKTTTTTSAVINTASSKLTTATTPNGASRGATTKSSGGSIRKKSKGHSLIANGPANKPFQCNTSINRTPVTMTPQALQQQQQTRYIASNFNQGYGRLLSINEPVYLPCSVAPIAPITLNQQQLLNHSRRPPFISRTAEAYLTHQNSRPLSHMASIHKALVNILKYLEVKDILSMRMVNHTFKTIVDSDIVWRRVAVESSNIVDWQLFAERILCKYKTTDLILYNYLPDRDNIADTVGDSLEEPSRHLKRISITTLNSAQNRFALEVICQLFSRGKFAPGSVIDWNVRVVIDDFGIAQVNLLCRDAESLKDQRAYHRNLYCYEVIDRLVGDIDELVQLEMSELQDLFSGRNDRHPHPYQVNVRIKAI